MLLRSLPEVKGAVVLIPRISPLVGLEGLFVVLGFQGVGARHLTAAWPPGCVAHSCRCSHGDIAGHAKALQGAAVVR